MLQRGRHFCLSQSLIAGVACKVIKAVAFEMNSWDWRAIYIFDWSKKGAELFAGKKFIGRCSRFIRCNNLSVSGRLYNFLKKILYSVPFEQLQISTNFDCRSGKGRCFKENVIISRRKVACVYANSDFISMRRKVKQALSDEFSSQKRKARDELFAALEFECLLSQNTGCC